MLLQLVAGCLLGRAGHADGQRLAAVAVVGDRHRHLPDLGYLRRARRLERVDACPGVRADVGGLGLGQLRLDAGQLGVRLSHRPAHRLVGEEHARGRVEVGHGTDLVRPTAAAAHAEQGRGRRHQRTRDGRRMTAPRSQVRVRQRHGQHRRRVAQSAVRRPEDPARAALPWSACRRGPGRSWWRWCWSPRHRSALLWRRRNGRFVPPLSAGDARPRLRRPPC